MWESPIHVYLFTLVNLLLFVYIISGTNMYTLNLPRYQFFTEKRDKNSYILPIKLLSYGNNCRLYIYLSIMTIILKINNIYICQNSSYYIRNSYNMYRLFFIFCDDLYDCKDDNMLLIYKYRKLNISENNVYTNKIQYEHYSLIPIEKWGSRVLGCNHISNFFLNVP